MRLYTIEVPEVGDQCFRYNPEDIGVVSKMHSSGELFYIGWRADGDYEDDIEEIEVTRMNWDSRNNRWEI